MPPILPSMEGEIENKVSFANTDDVIPPAENYDAVDRYVFGSLRRSVRLTSSSRIRKTSSVANSSQGAGGDIKELDEDELTEEDETFDESAAIAKHIEENVVGNETIFDGPYGGRESEFASISFYDESYYNIIVYFIYLYHYIHQKANEISHQYHSRGSLCHLTFQTSTSWT